MTKLSIITVNRNNLSGLQKTIESVFAQTFSDYEYLVIDGNSNDGSKELIEKYENQLAYCKSEKDSGIYDAMNKGILRAKGEYLLFLNSGDFLYQNDVFSDLFSRNPTADILYGNQFLIGYSVKKYPPNLPLEFFLSDTLPHQASFIKRSLFDKVGLYTVKYEMANDYKFFLEAIFNYQCSYKYYDITIVNFDMTGYSNIHSHKILDEFKAIRNEVLLNSIDEFEMLLANSKKLLQIENSRSYKLLKRIKKILKTESNKGQQSI